jgi:methylmalonyl-CoA/ethylmalonyl-CoA epimerase
MDKRIGQIDQMGFLVEDIEAAAHHWASVWGVGPFFVHRHVENDRFTYRGHDTAVDLTLAFSYLGDIQIELILPHNDAPSVYTDFRKTARTGLVHVAHFCDDLDAAAARFDVPVIQYSSTPDGVETIYLETSQLGAPFVEFIKVRQVHHDAMRELREVARQWDGRDPLRQIG